MESSGSFDTKYPKSKSGEQCLGPCYESGTWVIHPQTLDYIVDYDKAFCPVTFTKKIDPKTGKEVNKYLDECYVPTKEKDESKKDIEMSILLPQIDFNCSHFLKIYYDIHSFDDALDKIDEMDSSSIYTKLRIIECAFKAYGKSSDSENSNNFSIDVFDTRLVNFYISVVKKLWINDIYPLVQKYIYIDNGNGNIYLKQADGDSGKNKQNRVEKINFLIKKFVNEDTVYKFLDNYIKNNKSSWSSIRSHNEKIKDEFINFILTKVEKTVKI